MKKLLAILLALAMVLTLAACTPAADDSSSTDAGSTGQTEEASLKTITVIVVHSDGTSNFFEYKTAETYLGPVLLAEGLVQGNEGPYGLEIIEVDGEVAIYETSGAYWALYENDEYAMIGADGITLIDGGVYKLEFTRG